MPYDTASHVRLPTSRVAQHVDGHAKLPPLQRVRCPGLVWPLPGDFVAFQTRSKVRWALDEASVTGCWSDVSRPLASPIGPGAYLVRFLRDQQDCANAFPGPLMTMRRMGPAPKGAGVAGESPAEAIERHKAELRMLDEDAFLGGVIALAGRARRAGEYLDCWICL
jgi:hypothetical protein